MDHPIDPKTDCVFKALLGAEDNRDLLIHFLNAIEEQQKMSYVMSIERMAEERGEARGEARGETRGEARMLTRLLTLKFGPLSPETQQRISEADADTLLTWSERVLTANTIDEILR